MNHIVHQLAGTRVALGAIVGQFHLDYSAQGPQRLVRLVDVCLPDGTPVLDDYWCVLTAGMHALHLWKATGLVLKPELPFMPPQPSDMSG